MKTFYWQTLNSFIVVLAGTLTLVKPDEVNATTFLIIGLAIAALNRATKEINSKYLS